MFIMMAIKMVLMMMMALNMSMTMVPPRWPMSIGLIWNYWSRLTGEQAIDGAHRVVLKLFFFRLQHVVPYNYRPST